MGTDRRFLFTFAAKGLQPYIFAGGKLRDMVGATSLIDRLASRDFLAERLVDLGVSSERFEIRQAAAGTGRIVFLDHEEADRVAQVWPLFCHCWAPGLEVVQDPEVRAFSGADYAEVLKNSAVALEQARNFPAAELPEAGPFVRRAPRTGRPAVRSESYRDEPEEWVDASQVRKRAERQELRKSDGHLPLIAEAFGFTDEEQIPDDFETLAGSERSYLALVHPDGNKLGEMFLAVGQAMVGLPEEECAWLFKILSETVVAEGTRAAVEAAMKALREDERFAELFPAGPVAWPVAPLVLAGDDLTFVSRAHLAIPFLEAFLPAFRREMRERIAKLKEEAKGRSIGSEVLEKIPAELSAGAGVVFAPVHYPFAQAYELCESLAAEAKGGAKGLGDEEIPPSSLCFTRVTGSKAPEDFEGLCSSLLAGEGGVVLTGGPYYLDGAAEPQLERLKKLHQEASVISSGKARGLLELLRRHADAVPVEVDRVLEITRERLRDESPVGRFEQACRDLLGDDWRKLRVTLHGRDTSPWGDELVLRSLDRIGKSDAGSEKTQPEEQEVTA